MGNFSKLWGSLIGSAIGLGTGFGVLPEQFATPEIQGLLITVLSIAGTFFAPKNNG